MLGLEKMNSAKTDIDKMKEELKQKQQDLYQSQLETEALVAEIKLSKGMTEQERTKVEKIVSDVTAKVRTQSSTEYAICETSVLTYYYPCESINIYINKYLYSHIYRLRKLRWSRRKLKQSSTKPSLPSMRH